MLTLGPASQPSGALERVNMAPSAALVHTCADSFAKSPQTAAGRMARRRRTFDQNSGTIMTTSSSATTIGQYLIQRLHELGARHVFGIPGDYVLSFFKMLEESPLQVVGTTNELAAGYAADAYARIQGIGAACVTYGVGGLSLANAVACAYAEKSPVVVISGAPGRREHRPQQMLHHTIGGAATQQEVFEKITVASCCLNDPFTAFREIDRTLAACLRYKRPVYIELPRDCVNAAREHVHASAAEPAQSDPAALAEAVEETVSMLNRSARPVLIAGIEVSRFHLEAATIAMAEAHQLPMAAMLLSKSVIRENHPLYVGVYEAAMGRAEVTRFVEESDCVLMLGAFMHDIDTGMFTHQLDERGVIFATSEEVRVRRHVYQHVMLEDSLKALSAAAWPQYSRPSPDRRHPLYAPWRPEPPAPITIRRLFQKINCVLAPNMVVVADPGDALFAASDLVVHQGSEFLSPSFYATMGYAIPAAVGVQSANRQLRPLVLVGDGSFQMTGTELGTTARFGYDPIVIVLNNRGYGTERFLLEGAFNDIPNWNYHRLPELLGVGRGFEVRTEGELEQAVQEALRSRGAFTLLNVHLAQDDTSPALRRLAERLSHRV